MVVTQFAVFTTASIRGLSDCMLNDRTRKHFNTCNCSTFLPNQNDNLEFFTKWNFKKENSKLFQELPGQTQAEIFQGVRAD